jgi:Ca2+-binding RTX toxin-like protein
MKPRRRTLAISLATVLFSAIISVPASADRKPCTIRGTQGHDVLLGTDGRDVICGLGGDDELRGLGGNDILRGGDGQDRLFGGGGNDLLQGGEGGDAAFGVGAMITSSAGLVETSPTATTETT